MKCNLYQAFKDTNSAYWHAIAALKARDGIMPYNHFLIACGSPLRQKKHIPPETILKRLEKNEILSTKIVDGIGLCVLLTQSEEHSPSILSDLRARLVVEKILINAVSLWAKNLGLVSYNMFKHRDDEALPTVSTTLWDMAGPSYLSPLIEFSSDQRSKPKPGFFACDILLGKNIKEDDISPFLRKCNTLRGLSKVGRCMQMFIADDYNSGVFKLIKAAGVIPATVENLFGKDVAQGLVNLLRTLENAARSVTIEPERFNALFDQLGKIEGAVGNLRGVLFEYFSANVVEKAYPARNIKLNKICQAPSGESAESDVVAELAGEILFIECKGHQPSGCVVHEEVKRWLQVRVPILRKYALAHPDWKTQKLRFELWTTGKFLDESLDLLNKAKNDTTKYDINFLDAEGVMNEVKKCGDKEMLRTYKKCFLDHPLKKLEQQWVPASV